MTCKNVASNFSKSGKATKWYLGPNLEASVMKKKHPLILKIFQLGTCNFGDTHWFPMR
jgi:hypothetical protein